MLSPIRKSAPAASASAVYRSSSRAALLLVSTAAGALGTPTRNLSVRTEDFFSKEAVSHARRVSWAPHTTEKKVGAFLKLARSNFNDPLPESFHSEPYFEEEIEAWRAHHRPDVYIYRYNVSPTHLSLRDYASNPGRQAIQRNGMWTPHRFVGATAASPLVVARRYLHANKFSSTPPTTAANETGTSTVSASSPSSSSSAKDLQLDDTEEWALSQVQRSVESGRQTKEAADYFRSIMHEQPEFHQCLKEARRLIGGQDPERLTRYQQGQFADRLCTYMSGIASEKLRRIQAEEQSAKRYTQDGTPTGENYWFEAGNTLSSPAVPGFVKDEILCEMQQHRSAKSPAFERPPGEEEEDAHAVHLRRQRSKLFSDADFK